MSYCHAAALLLTAHAVSAQSTCWTRLQCTNPNCWLSTPCSGNAAYKRDFCDDFAGTSKCSCSGRFSAADQQKYGTHQLAEKPICPPQTAAPVVPAPTPTCAGRLQCPTNCWISTPCTTSKSLSAAYKAAFCDDYGRNQKCSCSGRFTAADQAKYGTHQLAAKPFCPDGDVQPAVSGDPFTTDKHGNRVQFFLPLHKDVMLLSCGDFALHGSSMGSGIAGDHQQWFEQFRVLLSGKEKLHVSANNTDALSNLTTIAVSIEGTPIRQTAEIAYDGFDIDVQQDKDVPIGRGFSETVHFSAGSTMLSIMSAGVMKVEGKNAEVRRVHLDLGFTSLDTSTCTAGILAEIWGNIPMSNTTTAMLQPPSH